MQLTAKKRTVLGKKVKSLRRAGTLPAVLFGGKEPSLPVELNTQEFEKVYQAAGESTLIDLKTNGKKEKILISEVQHDPLGKLLHADLKRIAAGEKITATVPLVVEGEAQPVKSGEGVLLTLLSEVEVECLPQDLPREIKVDLSSLAEIDQGITVGQLPIDQNKTKIVGHEPDELVVKVAHPQAAEEEEAPVAEEEAVAGVEATAEKKPEEVPTPAGAPTTAPAAETPGKAPEEKPTPQDRPRQGRANQK